MEAHFKEQMEEYIQDYEEAFIEKRCEDGKSIAFDMSRKDKMLAWYIKHNFIASLLSAIPFLDDITFTGEERHDNIVALHMYSFGSIAYGQLMTMRSRASIWDRI